MGRLYAWVIIIVPHLVAFCSISLLNTIFFEFEVIVFILFRIEMIICAAVKRSGISIVLEKYHPVGIAPLSTVS